MPIYKQNGNKLIAVREKRIDLEKTVQSLVEANLDDVFGLQFVTTEFALNSLRIDTLAFDEETKEDDTIVSKGIEDTTVQVVVDALSMMYLMGAQIDYQESLQGAHFLVKNPNAQTTCSCGSSFAIE